MTDTRWTATWNGLHDNAGCTLYEGPELAGRAETVISRCEVVVAPDADRTEPGRGRFVRQG